MIGRAGPQPYCRICGEYSLTDFSTDFTFSEIRDGEHFTHYVKVCNSCIKQAVKQRLEILGRI